MATRGTVAVENRDGSVTGIYTHWDSYLDNNGIILIENYNNEEKARELISGGDISSLRESVEDTVYYHRDKNESFESVKPVTKDSREAFLSWNNQEYNYIFKEGQWFVKAYDEDEIPLKEALSNDNISFNEGV